MDDESLKKHGWEPFPFVLKSDITTYFAFLLLPTTYFKAIYPPKNTNKAIASNIGKYLTIVADMPVSLLQLSCIYVAFNSSPLN